MKKIIISTVVLAVVLCLGISTLILSLIPVGMNDRVQLPSKVYIYSTVTKNSDSCPSGYLPLDSKRADEADKINQIYKLFNRGFQQKALSALFKGELKDGITEHKLTHSDTFTQKTSVADSYVVTFSYPEGTGIKAGGKTFNTLSFEFDNSGERNLTKLILQNDVSPTSSYITYQYYLEAKVCFNDLFDYLKELESVL